MLRWLSTRLSSLFRRARYERELDRELAFHLDMLAEQHVRDGMSPADARRAAARVFGAVDRVKDDVRDTWLSRNAGSYQVSPDWRLMAKTNFSTSRASQGNFYDGNFVDASFGGAFRPVANDRWNTLLQYRYFYSLPSPGQVGLTDNTLDYAERSHVISLDSIYDLVPWLSLGGKYAQRYGELQDTRVGGPWLSSRADLIILRGDLHVVRKWDVMIEGRRLTVFEAQDRRSGLLVALYRHMSKNVKLGVGYNCTDYSDDLTDLSYRSRGPFVNIMGTF